MAIAPAGALQNATMNTKMILPPTLQNGGQMQPAAQPTTPAPPPAPAPMTRDQQMAYFRAHGSMPPSTPGPTVAPPAPGGAPQLGVNANGTLGPTSGPNNNAMTVTGNPTSVDYNQQIQDLMNQFRGQNAGPNSSITGAIQPFSTPNISPDILNSMQKYTDAAYNQATSRLDPQFAQQKAAFDQQMVSQGLQPGSAAYNSALQDFNNAKNDAYSGARNQAMQQGLQAQGQAFGQGLAGSQLGLAANQQGWNQGIQGQQLGLAENQQGFNQALSGSQLANEILKARIAAEAQKSAAGTQAGATRAAAQSSADASRYNSQNNLLSNMFGDQTQQYLGQLQNSLGWGNLGLGAAQMGMQQNNQDFNQMMGLYNAGNQNDMYNNAIPGMEMGNIGQLLNMIPNGNPTPVDVTGAYGLNAGMQNNAYQGAVANNNAQNQTTGAVASTAIVAAIML